MVFGKKKQPPRIEFEEPVEEEIEEQEEEEVPTPSEKPKQAKEESLWQVREVPVESQKVIVNTKTKKVYDLYSAVVEILNRTEE